jgi:hypothetical protein
MQNLWGTFTIVSIADLFLTWWLLDAKYEGNPIAAWIWATFGFYGVIIYKVIAVTLILLVPLILVKNKRPHLAEIILQIAIILTTGVCFLFIPILMDWLH